MSLRITDPITDEDVDELLRKHPINPEYPALTSRNLRRREIRDDKRRDHTASFGGALDTVAANKSMVFAGVGDPVFNIHIGHSAHYAMNEDLVYSDLEKILDDMGVDEEMSNMVILRTMNGWTYEMIADELTTPEKTVHKQAVHRRLRTFAIDLASYWMNNIYFGLRAVSYQETSKSIYRRLGGDRQPIHRTSVCDCASHQFTHIKHTNKASGNTTVMYHCTNCKNKLTETEFRKMFYRNSAKKRRAH